MLDSLPRRLLPVVGGTLLGLGAATLAWRVDVRQRGHRTRALHRTLVETLLNVLSAGDAITARHSRRVADLCDVPAVALRISRGEHATLRVASLLHDMGKVDDRYFDILHSRKPLTPEQREEIEEHPHQSAHILEPLEKFHPGITEIVSSHHESWNGEGYPRGLRGEEIPLGARIIAVADVFDALTQRRAYRDPLSLEEVLDILREGAGAHFDPGIVRLVESPVVWERWRRIALHGRAEEEAARTTPATGEV